MWNLRTYSTVMSSCLGLGLHNGTLSITPDEPCQRHLPFSVGGANSSKHHHPSSASSAQLSYQSRGNARTARLRWECISPRRTRVRGWWKEKRPWRPTRNSKWFFLEVGISATFFQIEYISPVFAGSLKLKSIHLEKTLRR